MISSIRINCNSNEHNTRQSNGYFTVAQIKNTQNTRGKHGSTALIKAVNDGDIETIKQLIQSGIDVNGRDKNGETALINAARGGYSRGPIYTKILVTLIKAGADVNATDNEGNTALMNAAYEGNLEKIRALIGAGAKVNVYNNNGVTALINAAISGDFFPGPNFTHTWDGDYTNGIEVVKTLIEAGADVNATDNKGYSALAAAALHGGIETMKILLDAGANVNSQTNDGKTVLNLVASKIDYEHTGSIKELIDAGADVNKGDNRGRTPLMQAAYYKRLRTVKLLIESGANINTNDNNGNTALSLARESRFNEEAEKLIGKTCQTEIIELLVSAGSK